ncbi:hypothetical protein LINPERHAP1_LOCUS29688 [Linum perenne]
MVWSPQHRRRFSIGSVNPSFKSRLYSCIKFFPFLSAMLLGFQVAACS